MAVKRKITPIGGVLSGFFSRREWHRRLALHQVFLFWDKAVGQEIAKRANPSVIRGDVLWVNVTDSVWMQQLHLQKVELLEKINSRLGQEEITDIRFQLDTTLSQPTERKKEKPPLKVKPVDAGQKAEFDSLSDCLADEEAKENLRRLWLKYHQYAHSDTEND